MSDGEIQVITGPRWTSTKPTQPGYYWFKGWYVREVDYDDERVDVGTPKIFEIPLDTHGRTFVGEWAGPLEVPQ